MSIPDRAILLYALSGSFLQKLLRTEFPYLIAICLHGVSQGTYPLIGFHSTPNSELRTLNSRRSLHCVWKFRQYTFFLQTLTCCNCGQAHPSVPVKNKYLLQ